MCRKEGTSTDLVVGTCQFQMLCFPTVFIGNKSKSRSQKEIASYTRKHRNQKCKCM